MTEIYAVILVGLAMPISVALIGLIYRRNGRSNNKNGPVIVKRDELWETFRAREANIARLIDAQGEQGRILSQVSMTLTGVAGTLDRIADRLDHLSDRMNR